MLAQTKEHQREYWRERKQKSRKAKRQWYLSFLQGRSCEICGETDPVTFDWHHRDPKQKEGGISVMLKDRSKTAILNELKKCQCLCANCHRKVHRDLRNGM